MRNKSTLHPRLQAGARFTRALPKLAPLARRYRLVADYSEGGETLRVMVDIILLGRGRTEISLLASAPYAARKSVDAAEVRLAKGLLARVRA